MSEELDPFVQSLVNAGVSTAALNILKENEFTSTDQLANFTYDQLIAMGIKPVSAEAIARNFGKKPEATNGTQAFPAEVKLVAEKTIQTMKPSELMEYLVQNPHDAEALTQLKSISPVKEAAARADNWAIQKDHKLDVTTTLDYCRYLGKFGSSVQVGYKGGICTSLESILGIVEKALLHPLKDDELIHEGIDSLGNDWTNIPREIMRALFWARKTNHRLWPKNSDAYDIFHQINVPNPKGRWENIIQEFDAAVADQKPETFFTLSVDPSLLNKIGKILKSVPSDGDLETYVRSNSSGPKNVNGSGNNIKGVYDSLTVHGSGCNFKKVVVLGSVNIQGSGHSGVIYYLKGVPVKMSGSGNDVDTIQKTWDQLAEIIRNQ